MENNTATKLALIAKRAKENKRVRYTSLMHHINVDFLMVCYKDLKRGKAPGVDGKVMEEYTQEEMRTVLRQTVADIKAKRYRPQPVKRVYIEKAGSGKKRPLGLPTVVDKVVQEAVKRILESIYEADFLDCSYGYRPGRNAHEALKAVNHMVMQKKVNWILDADVKGFFDHIDHAWMMECLAQRIADPNFKSLIYRFLKGGVMEHGRKQPTDSGTPQGGIISPVLANIYLHYVLDLWYTKRVRIGIKGDTELIRYADDFVIGFQYQEQAQRFLNMLRERLSKFHLLLAEEKTHIIEFGRFAEENHRKRGQRKPKTFTFLGMTHYCGRTRDGRFKLGVKTSSKSMRRSVVAMNLWLKAIRNRTKAKTIWKILRSKLQGHYNYYGISGNFASIQAYHRKTVSLTFKWFNRRSQKQSFNWEQFRLYLERYPLPQPKRMFQIYNTW